MQPLNFAEYYYYPLAFPCFIFLPLGGPCGATTLGSLTWNFAQTVILSVEVFRQHWVGVRGRRMCYPRSPFPARGSLFLSRCQPRLPAAGRGFALYVPTTARHLTTNHGCHRFRNLHRRVWFSSLSEFIYLKKLSSFFGSLQSAIVINFIKFLITGKSRL